MLLPKKFRANERNGEEDENTTHNGPATRIPGADLLPN